MKVAIISDIHANAAALQALKETWDELWVIGDLVNYGPSPRPVVDWVRTHAHLAVRGNHDHAIGFATDPRCSPPYKAMAAETGRYSESVLDESEKRYLERLPLTVERRLAHQRFHICHAMPSDPLFGYMPADDHGWEHQLQLTGADVLIVGHTHTPFIRQFGEKYVVNPGSVGQPKTGTPEACYAVWEDGRIELRRYSYPLAETEEGIMALPIADDVKRDLIYVLRTGGELRREQE